MATTLIGEALRRLDFVVHSELREMVGGYKNNAEEVLFYDFAVQFYDVSFKYKGKSYYLLTESDHVAVCDSHFSEEYETFKDAVELIENYHINGRSLLELIDSLEDVEPE